MVLKVLSVPLWKLPFLYTYLDRLHFRSLDSIWLTSCFADQVLRSLVTLQQMKIVCAAMNPRTLPRVGPRPSFQSTQCWSLPCFALCIHCGWTEFEKKIKGCPGVHIWWSVMRTGTWDIKSINTSWTMWHAVTLLMHFPTLWRSLLCSCAALIVFHFTIINSCERGGDLELSFIHILPFRGRPSRLEKGLRENSFLHVFLCLRFG